MPERTSEEILEMARGEIAARKAHSIALRSMRELPWRYAFIGLAGVLLLGLLAWPGAPLEWKMYAVVHGVCAQAHNVDMAGMRLPLCARNTGIYSGFLVTVLYLLALGDYDYPVAMAISGSAPNSQGGRSRPEGHAA